MKETKSKGKMDFRSPEEIGSPISPQGIDQRNRISRRLKEGIINEGGKSNPFRPDMITGECRIVTVGGKVIAGTPIGWFDDAILIQSVSSDEVVVRMAAIESVWNGLISPQQRKAMEGGKKDEGNEEQGKDGLSES